MRFGLLTCLVAPLVLGPFGCGGRSGGSGGFAPIPALIEAHPAGDACALETPESDLFASYRKDTYLPSEVYSEPTDPPLDGGRIQVAGIAVRSCEVTGLRIEGVDAQELVT